jgi:hypothetical protein
MSGQLPTAANLSPNIRRQCPKCGRRDVRWSRTTQIERILNVLRLRPYRCLTCFYRFWRFG